MNIVNPLVKFIIERDFLGPHTQIVFTIKNKQSNTSLNMLSDRNDINTPLSWCMVEGYDERDDILLSNLIDSKEFVGEHSKEWVYNGDDKEIECDSGCQEKGQSCDENTANVGIERGRTPQPPIIIDDIFYE